MKFKLKLRTKFAMVYIGVAVVLIAVIGIYSYTRYQSILYNQIVDSYEQSTTQMKNHIEYKISTYKYIATQTIKNPTIQAILDIGVTSVNFSELRRDNLKTLKNILSVVNSSNESIKGIYFYRNNKNVPTDGSYLFNDDIIAGLDWYQEFNATNQQELWKKKDYTYGGAQLIEYFIPIYKELSPTDFTQDMKRLGTFALTFPEKEFLNIINQVEQGDVLVDISGPNLEISADNKQKSKFHSKDIYISEKIAATNLKLNVYVPFASISKSIFDINKDMIIIVMLLGIISIILIVFLTNIMTRRIYQLRNKMTLIQENKIDLLYNLGGHDEITELDQGLNEMVYKLRKLLKDLYKYDTAKKDAELKFLQIQINPHFLYNTLDSIKSCVDLGYNENAVKMLISLKNYFRIGLNRGMDTIYLEDEIKHACAYIDIQQFRLDYSFKVEWQIDEPLKKFKIMKTILQPVIENSLQYGFEEKVSNGKIIVRAKTFNGFLYICVFDNGCGVDTKTLKELTEILNDPKSKSSVGLKNIKDRLSNYYGKQCEFKFYSARDKGFFTIIKIPMDLIE